MKSISIERVREIVNEELESLNEKVDHEGIRLVVDSASRLLTAMEDFEEDASGPMTNASSLALKRLRGILEHIIENPETYLDRSKKIVVRKKSPTHKLLVKDPSTVRANPAKKEPVV